MPVSLLQPLGQCAIAVVDVETTGASADFGHRVIELGIVRIENGTKVAEYAQLLDPQRRISAGVTALTGISQDMVAGRPTFAQQLPRIIGLLQNAIVLGHNVRFDLSFLNKEFRRAGRPITDALGPAVPVLDTVRIARRRYGRGGNGLGSLARRHGIEPVVAHRALADAQTTHLVFEQLIAAVGGWSLCLCDAYREQGGPMGLLPANPRESPLPLELEEALEQRRPVLLDYLDARQQRTQRVVEPLTIRRFRGELLLVAHCHLRADQRTFKLERIVALSRIDGPIPTNLPTACDDPPQGPPVEATESAPLVTGESASAAADAPSPDAAPIPAPIPGRPPAASQPPISKPGTAATFPPAAHANHERTAEAEPSPVPEPAPEHAAF